MSDINVSLTLKLRNLLGKGIGEARRDLTGLRTEAAKLGSGAGADKLTGDLKRVDAAAGAAKRDIIDLRRQAAAMTGSQDAEKLAAGLRRVGVEADRAARATARVRMPAARAGAGSGSGATSGVAPAAGGTSVLAAGRGTIGAVGGVLAAREAIRRTVGEAITFERAMAEVKKKVDVPSTMKPEEAFKQIEASVKRLSVELGIPAQKVAALTAEAGASGIAFADLERFMRLTAKSAVAWDIAPEETSEKLAAIKASTGRPIAEIEQIGDKINALGDASNAKERDILEMFSRSAAAAKEAGVDFDTTLAAVTAVRSAGMQPEIASRWFNSFAGGLRTIEDGTSKAKEGLKMLGLDAKTVSAGMQKDSVATIRDLFDRLTKSPDAARASFKLFGAGWWDETLRAKAALPEFVRLLELVRNPAAWKGSSDKALQIELATTGKQLERMKALVSDIGDRMGRWALPGINSAVKKAIDLFDELERRNKVREAGQDGDADKPPPSFTEDPVVWAARKTNEALKWARDKSLDTFIAPRPTDDPKRGISRQMLQEADDAGKVSDRLRKEADELSVQAGSSKVKSQRKGLNDKAAALRAQAETLDGEKRVKSRIGGRMAAGDMTDVEVGEAAARKAVAAQRALKARIAELEATLASTPNKVVQDPAKGTFAARDVIEAELESVRAKLRELVGEGRRRRPS